MYMLNFNTSNQHTLSLFTESIYQPFNNVFLL